MKGFLICFILLSSVFFADAQSKNNAYVLKGKVPGIRTGIVYFSEFVINGKRDSAEIRNGKFKFSGKFENPMPVVIRVAGNSGSFLFFAENNKMKLVLNKDSLRNSKLTGSATNQDLREYDQKLRPQNDRLNTLSAWSRSRGKLDKKIEDSVSHQWEIIAKERNAIANDFIREHPNSIVAAYVITRHFLSIPELTELEAQYNSLAEKVQQTTFGKQIKAKIDIERLTAVGRYAMDFTQNDTLGNPVSLSSFKGRYVLLDFWASWCVPCRKENPHVVTAFNKYKDKNFTVLGVSLDRPGKKHAWLEAIYQDQLAWTHVSDLKFWDNEVSKKYGIGAIPQNFLLDPSGKIIAKNIRGEELQKKLEEFIK